MELVPSCPQWWVEFLKTLPSIVTAATAIYGVYIAKAGLEKWRRETIGKRKAEIAEAVLADFYQARDILNAARSPGGFGDEGNTREKADWETEKDTNAMNAYYRTLERLQRNREFFAQLWAHRYRFLALFGEESAKPYDELFRIRGEVILAVHNLLSAYQDTCNLGPMPNDRNDYKKWKATIGWGMPEDDSIEGRMKDVIDAIEKICRPAIQESIAS